MSSSLRNLSPRRWTGEWGVELKASHGQSFLSRGQHHRLCWGSSGRKPQLRGGGVRVGNVHVIVEDTEEHRETR